MLIYRVESLKDGRGPYTNCATNFDRSYYAHRPGPNREWFAEHFDDSLHRFAFASLEQLLHWFYDELDKFRAYPDYIVKVLEVPEEHVFIGQWQVIFDPTQATEVNRINIV